VRQHKALRRASAIQFCLFGGFSVFWSTLALMLEGPPYHLGSAAAGLFGVLGLAGVAGAPYAGRLADKRGPHMVIGAGTLTMLVAFACFGLWRSLAGLIVGVVLLDLGVQMTQIANQTIIFSLDEAARSRINTVYVTALFLGGAFGSAVASIAWRQAGWGAVSALGAALAVVAFLIHLSGRRAR
jgi:predicted MFS family arabinose efflux permease